MFSFIGNIGNFNRFDSFLCILFYVCSAKMELSQKDKIIEKATKLFKSFGTQSVSMDDLCKELVISKKTLYQEISDKKELIQEVIQSINEKHQIQFGEIFENEKDPTKATLLMAKMFIQEMENTSVTLIYDLRKYYPENYKTIQEFKHTFFFKKAHEIVKRGIEKGLYRKDIHTSMVTSFYLSLCDEVLGPTQIKDSEVRFKERVNQMLEYHLHAVCTEKGLRELEIYKQNKDLWL